MQLRNNLISLIVRNLRFKHTINYTKVPKLLPNEIEEQFVRGSGPGGQSVNKTANAVLVKHLPTGIVVKCHQTRSLEENRKRAKAILVTKLDNLINKEESVEAQQRAIGDKKNANMKRRREKLLAMKMQWKERENLE